MLCCAMCDSYCLFFVVFSLLPVPILPESGLFNVDNVRVVKILVRQNFNVAQFAAARKLFVFEQVVLIL